MNVTVYYFGHQFSVDYYNYRSPSLSKYCTLMVIRVIVGLMHDHPSWQPSGVTFEGDLYYETIASLSSKNK